jgi:hypothetical protein
MTDTPKVPHVPKPKFIEKTDDWKYVVIVGGVRPKPKGGGK